MRDKIKSLTLAFICLALAAALCIGLLYQSFPMPYKDTVEKYGREYGVERDLIYAVIKAESNFDPAAVSHAGAKGLAQLTDATARYVAEMIGIEYDSGDSFKAEKNIQLAVYYLRYLLNKYDGDLHCTIAAYNAGEGNVDKWLASDSGVESIPFKETERYVKKVKLYRKIYGVLYR
ncbi:MAG: lytic transglycosylase domain-containing protein [Clostridia bacterium]